jgi:hypothetical protein|tara:strand:- start:597 stop:791 length:195 start_codon:yes stop_codon:yes gene_type:complete
MDITLILTIIQLVVILALLMTAGKIGKILDRVQGSVRVVRINLDQVDNNLDHLIKQIREIEDNK